jgi:hypothetical protein
MSGKSEQPGSCTSDVEITNVSKHGFWLILDVDLAVGFIDRPDEYPLVSKVVT